MSQTRIMCHWCGRPQVYCVCNYLEKARAVVRRSKLRVVIDNTSESGFDRAMKRLRAAMKAAE